MISTNQSLLNNKGFFWKIEDSEGHKGYLLGSIHLGSQELIETNIKIMKCFNKAKSLALEVNNDGEIVNEFNKIRETELKKLIDQLNIDQIKNEK